ncbi:UDP-4-amino-4,6-dideoxy-N-acetyl-beta-L-altrosamine N-acetyltransferase [Salinimicrobium sp. TH3]|uniref:UDP-4-amino-4, 6-dideoxy-N-acetyl-beta-L-altrosamine N-acetyltransferase n=1 Tax=Salinimicrobium sp. TH3 TaxID=2997342 RepID=UPI002273A7B3|nr:UDP-4-amino-4,6-dideoxy-N-acetyl-beta-L-altrosamine N-acetyltransferase [Salinimicrobium sp. TH3]MCY2686955.1 UDP-4-amino-4,6-dideoxy-N-acetyl-beta-L-altrosamine N-acetyltransferase [Salinimicrobium sp. TH3]
MDEINFTEVKEADLEMIRQWRNSPEVGQYMYTDNEISAVQQKKWFDKISLEENSRYWVIEFQKKKLGLVYLVHIDFKHSKCFWGFYLGDTSIRGKGIGAKVEYKVLEYVFEELKLNKLCGEVLSFNEKVIKMHEKFGFKQEGYLRQHVNKNGSFMDVVSIGLLKSEWKVIKDDLYKKVYRFS